METVTIKNNDVVDQGTAANLDEKGDPIMNPRFVEARAKLHEARRMESQLGFGLMVDFIKYRKGDVTSSEIARLFHEWAMPYPAGLYIAARQKAHVPLRKPLSRRNGHEAKSRRAELGSQWRELVQTTPDSRRPRMIETKAESALGPVPSPWIPQEVPNISLRNVSTGDLLDELHRRETEAAALLERLGKLGKK